MKFAKVSFRFPGRDPAESHGSARIFHKYILDRAHEAGFKVPMAVETKKGKVAFVKWNVAQDKHAPIVLNWIQDWRANNSHIVHDVEIPEELPDDVFRKEIHFKLLRSS